MTDPAWLGQTGTASRTEAWARGQGGHAHRPSLTTNASGIPDSVISYTSTAEVHAHEFPRPPSTIPSSPATPTTPRSMAYSQYQQTPYSPLTPYHSGHSAPSQPLMPRRPSVSNSPPAYSTSPLSSEYTSATEKTPRPNVSATPRHSFGPRALPARPLTRHASSSRMVPMPPALPEGEVVNHTVADYPISTISFDSRAPADHSDTRTLSSDILSTSFITDLISSTSPKQNPQQEDDSIISAITYPPVQTYTPLPSREEARAPPSAFQGYHNLDNASSLDHSGMVPIGLHGSGHNRDSYQSSAADTSFARSVSSRTPLRNDIQPDRSSVAPFEHPETYLPQPQRRRKSVSRYAEARQSMHSTRSQTGSIISRISSTVRAQWRRIKPLPPVPTLPNVSVAQAQQHRQLEEALPLPALAGRSRELANMLEKGYQPHQSVYNLGDAEQAILQAQARKAASNNPAQAEAYTRTVEYSYTHPGGITGVLPKEELAKAAAGKKKKPSKGSKLFQGNMRIVILASFGIVVVAVIAAAVAAVVLTKHKEKTCAAGLAGAQCNLVSTCVCTGSATSGVNCMPLAQNLATLVPSMNSFFNTNLSTNAVALSLWEAQGDIGTSDCSKQAVLVDIAPAAPIAGVQSNWTQWTQSALLWTTVQSQNLTGVSNLRKFVAGANWAGAASGGAGDAFKTTALGYQYDFLGQTIVEPPQSFVNVGKADATQQGRLDNGATATLDRMYSHAVAASNQQAMSLSKYWTATLQQDLADLPKFLSAVQSSSIVLPFDGTSSTLSSQLTNSTTTPFPPPLACYPGLNADTVSRLNTIETSVFGLPSASAASSLQTSCYPDRPIYGVLNVLRLRWPLLRNGTASQSVVLKQDASPRTVVYSGEALSALPLAKDAPPVSSYSTDPRQYGTIANMNHVLLRWFTTIDDVGVVNALVQFVLSSSTVPPPSGSLVYQKLSSIPKLEVAVFGSVLPGDVDSVNSGWSTPTNGWYFGSPQSLALRQWAINAAGAEVVWAPNATSPVVVRDNALPGSTNFLKVWVPSAQSFAAGVPFDSKSMNDLTQSFTAQQLFSA